MNNLTTMLNRTILKNPFPEILKALKITKLPINKFMRLISQPVVTGKINLF